MVINMLKGRGRALEVVLCHDGHSSVMMDTAPRMKREHSHTVLGMRGEIGQPSCPPMAAQVPPTPHDSIIVSHWAGWNSIPFDWLMANSTTPSSPTLLYPAQPNLYTCGCFAQWLGLLPQLSQLSAGVQQADGAGVAPHGDDARLLGHYADPVRGTALR